MASDVQLAIKLGVAYPPPWLSTNLHYETVMGSRAYGVAEKDGNNDHDIYGIAIPPKDLVFPHTAGLIYGFDLIPAFDQWQQHHVKHPSSEMTWDFQVFSIVKFFRLAADNNPTIIDSLFTPNECVKHCTSTGRLIRDARKLFLSKLVWKKFRGYSSSQWHKVESKNPEGKRKETVDKFGFDVKFAYHTFRLLREAEQLLSEGDLSLTRGNDELKAIRRGEWSLSRCKAEYEKRMIAVEELHGKTTLPERPDHERLKKLLLTCLEEHYGSIQSVLPDQDRIKQALREIDSVVGSVRNAIY